MSHSQTRTRRLLSLLAAASCIGLAGCGVLIPVSKVQAPPSVEDEPKAKSADPCQSQGQDPKSSADCKSATSR